MNNSSENQPVSAVDRNFRVIYRGRLLPGNKSNAVSATLKSRFKMSDKQIAAFHTGRKFVVKQALSRARAVQIRDKLKQAGLDVVANSASRVNSENTHTPQPRRQKPDAPRDDTNVARTKQAETPSFIKQIPKPISAKDNSRWVIMGIGVLFTAGVIWLFFSI